MERWCGKVALVTGASSGIGAKVAEEFVKHGLKVVGLARRVEKVEELKNKIGKVKGELFPFKGDVSKEEDILKVFEWIKIEFGTIHVLVNNAGIVRIGKLVDGKTEHWKEVFDVNVIGLSICTRQAYQLMRESGVDNGHIIHINSVLGHGVAVFPDPAYNVYSASKYAVTALTETLRQELSYFKTKIRVSSISPGAVDTEIIETAFEASNVALAEDEKDNVAKRPSLQAKDVADAVVYVLSAPPHVQVHDLIIKPVGEAF